MSQVLEIPVHKLNGKVNTAIIREVIANENFIVASLYKRSEICVWDLKTRSLV